MVSLTNLSDFNVKRALRKKAQGTDGRDDAAPARKRLSQEQRQLAFELAWELSSLTMSRSEVWDKLAEAGISEAEICTMLLRQFSGGALMTAKW